ncbi:MAG: helix-turn-helix domain-containing protein [Dehalococcoidia bacterium]|nr:helix-turn-helix domain-containing protein [Dehalococcoidia bacterium]
MARSYDQLCPIARTLDIIGERWTLLILREFVLGRTRFSEFLEQLSGIPATVLSDRLKKLERQRLVERVIYSQHPLRAEYHLTAKGETLKPVLGAIGSWGVDHVLTPRERALVLEHVPAGLIPEGAP